MSIVKIRGKVQPCCAAPPRPDPAEPACPAPADDRWSLDINQVRFCFCCADCKARFASHPDWGPAIAADIRSKL